MKKLGKIFRFSTLRSQIIATIMLTSLMVISLSTFFFTSYGIKKMEASITKEMSTVVNMAARRNATALSFQNRVFSQESLSNLSEIEDIKVACLYDASGSVFASYSKSNGSQFCSGITAGQNGVFDETAIVNEGYVTITKNIFSGGELVGVISMQANTSRIDAYVLDQLATAATIMLLILSLSYFVTLRLHKLISNPILEVVEFAQSASKINDFSVRAPATQHKELEKLVDAFNDILTQREELHKITIQDHKTAVRAYNSSKYNLDSALKRLKKADNAMSFVSTVLHDKLLGSEVENYLPYVSDLDKSVTEYKTQMQSFQDLSALYERTLSEDKNEINIEAVLEQFISLWADSREGCKIEFNNLGGQKKKQLYSEPIYESLRIIFGLADDIYDNTKENYHFAIKVEDIKNASTVVTFTVGCDSFAGKNEQPEEEVVSQIQFGLDCVKYLSIVNNISLQFLPLYSNNKPSFKIVMIFNEEAEKANNIIGFNEAKALINQKN